MSGGRQGANRFASSGDSHEIPVDFDKARRKMALESFVEGV